MKTKTRKLVHNESGFQRHFVEAMGGKKDILLTMPDGTVIRIKRGRNESVVYRF